MTQEQKIKIEISKILYPKDKYFDGMYGVEEISKWHTSELNRKMEEVNFKLSKVRRILVQLKDFREANDKCLTVNEEDILEIIESLLNDTKSE